jgi:hypothetical protein
MALSTPHLGRSLALLVTLAAAWTLTAPTSAQSTYGRGRQQERQTGRFQPLRDVIQSTVAPNTWDEVGGEGSIRIVDAWGVAVVSQTQAVHDEIGALLATIRRVRMQQDEDLGVSDDATRPGSVFRSANLKSRNQIDSALDSKTEMSFLDAPLKEAVESLEQHHQIPIEIDITALGEAGLTDDAPVTKELAGISLRSGLKLLLRDLDLTFLIDDEVLQITTPEEAETRLVTVVYPVKDLAAANE